MRYSLYVVGTESFVGKTELSLCLARLLEKRGEEVICYQPVSISDAYSSNLPDQDNKYQVTLREDQTSAYLKEEIDLVDLEQRLMDHYTSISSSREGQLKRCILDGCGHCMTGAFFQMHSARLASFFGAGVILVAAEKGELSSLIDKIALCKASFDSYGVRLQGVVVNRISPHGQLLAKKTECQKALNRWNLPLLGWIPEYRGDDIQTHVQNSMRENIYVYL